MDKCNIICAKSMKTSFVQIETTDNLASIQDKMRWVRANRVLLMLPDNGLFFDLLELQMVKRYARELGAQVAILTHDEDVRQIALEVGIPVFKNLRSAQSSSWSRRHRSSLG